VHRRAGGCAALRRFQHVGHRFQGRWSGLPAAVHPGEVGSGEVLAENREQKKKAPLEWGAFFCCLRVIRGHFY